MQEQTEAPYWLMETAHFICGVLQTSDNDRELSERFLEAIKNAKDPESAKNTFSILLLEHGLTLFNHQSFPIPRVKTLVERAIDICRDDSLEATRQDLIDIDGCAIAIAWACGDEGSAKSGAGRAIRIARKVLSGKIAAAVSWAAALDKQSYAKFAEKLIEILK